jgi:ribosomal subunit interface protein
MKLEIHFHQMDSSEAIKSYIEKATERLSRYVSEEDSVKVVVGANGIHQVYAEIFWHDTEERKDLFAKEEAPQGQDLYSLIDTVTDKVFAQMQKAHDKRIDRQTKRDPLKKLVQ